MMRKASRSARLFDAIKQMFVPFIANGIKVFGLSIDASADRSVSFHFTKKMHHVLLNLNVIEQFLKTLLEL